MYKQIYAQVTIPQVSRSLHSGCIPSLTHVARFLCRHFVISIA
jgi:hypothetical protein